MDTEKVLHTITTALDDRKGLDIQVIHVTDVTVLTDYIVIASGTSVAHNRGLCGAVEEAMEKAGADRKLHIEGEDSACWILMDYGDVVVHIFHRQDREYYDLERLWDPENLRAMQANRAEA